MKGKIVLVQFPFDDLSNLKVLMSQISEMDDDLQPEYDFTQLTVVARGAGRKKSNLIIQLDPDVATIFPDSSAVNEGLRLLMRLIKQQQSLQSVTESEKV